MCGIQKVARSCFATLSRETLCIEVGTQKRQGNEDGEKASKDPGPRPKKVARLGAVKELEMIELLGLGKNIKIGEDLDEALKPNLLKCLKEYPDIFAWGHDDMPGIDPKFINHRLAVNPSHKSAKQKIRTFNQEQCRAMAVEVEKLLKASFIREVKYPEWVSNVVLVKKPNGKWRMYVDFTDLNKACPKDSFSLPKVDQLVDSTACQGLLSFTDAFLGYNQVRMHPEDEENMTFITDQGLYCYKVMPIRIEK